MRTPAPYWIGAALGGAAFLLTLGAAAAAKPEREPLALQALVDQARPGDRLEIPAGHYAGPLIVDKPLTLEGIGLPVIDGGGQGTVVTLAAPGIVFRGFEVRGSGSSPNHNDAGVKLEAPDITVEGNRLRDVLVGIFVASSDRAVLHGNDVSGKAGLDQGRKGDGIRVWYSQDVAVEDNLVHDVRDVVVWYSDRPRLHGNTISGSRYGIHLMYSDGARLEANRLLENSVGIFVMYSGDITLIGNLIRGQRGPSGYALGFKDSDGLLVSGNVLADDRVGIFLDGTPFSRPESTLFANNVLAFNDIGVLLQPAVRGNRFLGNTFWENTEQVAFHGGGLSQNTWDGNTWSDYAGFDADQDGVGDLPYEPRRLFDSLTDTEPRLRMILHSPAAQAMEFAAAAFPIVRPQSSLIDASPRLAPAALPDFALPEAAAPAPLILAGILLAGAGLVGGGLAYVQSGSAAPRATDLRIPVSAHARPVLAVEGVVKRYGKVLALEQVSLQANAGEALALWGPNGAGKTTLLNAILGLTPFEGRISVLGEDSRRQGKAARRHIGYVPQVMTFYEGRVTETIRFFARLRHADPERALMLLDQLGLGPQLGKPVSALSGGMRQRLALAIALIGDPPLLLLDEPTANLDVRARREHMALLDDLRRQGRTLVFATHRLEELEALADRVAMLDHGRLIEVLTPTDFLQRFAPKLEMTVRVPSEQVSEAFRLLERAGFSPRLNGRDRLVLWTRPDLKVKVLDALRLGGVAVSDFGIEEPQPWS
jgi:nitrous oxidase accessory protein